jgi:predicted TIM-barrel fold metal-dependent hydrolase
LKAQGVVGVAFNLPFFADHYYARTEGLVEKLVEQDLFLQIQVHQEQLLTLLQMLERSPVKLLIDHCGRPDIGAGLEQPAFQALLELGRSGRATVKLSGQAKFAQDAYPYKSTWPFIEALVDAFTLDRCIWGSDWPFLRAPHRIDYGPLLKLVEQLFPDRSDREKLLWRTPQRLFGFAA